MAIDTAELTLLTDWMRSQGIRRVRLASGIELELGSAQAPPAHPRAQASPEDEARAKHEARRRRYERELGRTVTDEELRRLP